MGARAGPPWGGATIVEAYASVGALGAAISFALGHDPTACHGWLGARGIASLLLSVGAGLCLGAATIAVTRAMMRRTEWARALHVAMRPAVHGAGNATLFALSLASAAGEELLFRGLLVPFAGVVGSSLLFGVLHQIPGRGRWGWMAWATIMGLLLALLFKVTGSLAGPLLAHLAINHSNLRYLRDNDPAPRQRMLGGLLNR
ncbi:MAG: CPBP family intramembrane metalloprotease [Myxococcota bacterium]|nr:CPBP family intramembrane metalloprotease [Myxococcota bacterium]